jgi:hypothetical protein
MRGELRIEFTTGEVLSFAYAAGPTVPMVVEWAMAVIHGDPSPLRITTSSGATVEYQAHDVAQISLTRPAGEV